MHPKMYQERKKATPDGYLIEILLTMSTGTGRKALDFDEAMPTC